MLLGLLLALAAVQPTVSEAQPGLLRSSVSSHVPGRCAAAPRLHSVGSTAIAGSSLAHGAPIVGGDAAVLRLRGGADLVASIKGSYFAVPLITRSWLSLVIVLAAVAQAKIIPAEALGIDAAAIAKGFQLWRPLTAASFFGEVGPQLLQKCYYLVQFGRELESEIGVGEYARVLFSCLAVETFLCHLLGWPFLADALIMSVTVLATLQNPERQVPNPHLPAPSLPSPPRNPPPRNPPPVTLPP